MSKASTIKRVFAAGAFAAALIAAPLVAPAMADGDHRGHRYEHRDRDDHRRDRYGHRDDRRAGGYEHRHDRAENWNRAHRRLHKAGIRHRHPHKHERKRHSWNRGHGHGQKHVHKHRRPHKSVYIDRRPVKKIVKVVHVQPRHDPQERLIASLIEAVVAASRTPHHR